MGGGALADLQLLRSTHRTKAHTGEAAVDDAGADGWVATEGRDEALALSLGRPPFVERPEGSDGRSLSLDVGRIDERAQQTAELGLVGGFSLVRFAHCVIVAPGLSHRPEPAAIDRGIWAIPRVALSARWRPDQRQ